MDKVMDLLEKPIQSPVDFDAYVLNGEMTHEQILESLTHQHNGREWHLVVEQRIGDHFGIGFYFSPRDPENERQEDLSVFVFLKAHNKPPSLRGVKNVVKDGLKHC